MPGKGVLFAIEPAEERTLLSFPDARSRVAWVANTVEERWDVDWLHAVETLWFPLHYCLHGSSGFPLAGASAEAKAIFGGAALGVPGLYTIDYKDGELTRRIANGLSRMRPDAVWARAGLVDRKDYGGPPEPDLKVAVVDGIHALAEFYRHAAQAGRGVIFTVDM